VLAVVLVVLILLLRALLGPVILILTVLASYCREPGGNHFAFFTSSTLPAWTPTLRCSASSSSSRSGSD